MPSNFDDVGLCIRSAAFENMSKRSEGRLSQARAPTLLDPPNFRGEGGGGSTGKMKMDSA